MNCIHEYGAHGCEVRGYWLHGPSKRIEIKDAGNIASVKLGGEHENDPNHVHICTPATHFEVEVGVA